MGNDYLNIRDIASAVAHLEKAHNAKWDKIQEVLDILYQAQSTEMTENDFENVYALLGDVLATMSKSFS